MTLVGLLIHHLSRLVIYIMASAKLLSVPKMVGHIQSCEEILISHKCIKPIHPPLVIQRQHVSEVGAHTHQRLVLSKYCGKFTFNICIQTLTRMNSMCKLKFILDRKSFEIIYTSSIRPTLEYAVLYWVFAHNKKKPSWITFMMNLVEFYGGQQNLFL